MRTLKLTIAYDGTRYAGWQIQQAGARGGGRGARPRPTLQGTLERVLQRVLREPVRVVGSGRTDAGVHALAQAAHVRTRSGLSTVRLVRSINALLPDDIAVMRLEDAERGFHARFDAARKRYRYRIFTGPVVPPFLRRYVHQIRVPLNVALMRREAAVLRGRHDVRAFARATSVRGLTIRRMTDVRIQRRNDELVIEIEGEGFLHTMVRSIAGTLIDVGRGRLPPGTMRRALRVRDRRLIGTIAPAKGLTLVAVSYGRSPDR